MSGSAAPSSRVLLAIDGTQTGAPLSVDSSGRFSTHITLHEGENRLTATAENRAGPSTPSGVLTLHLDTSRPDAPSGLTAQAREEGQIQLSWNSSTDPRVESYDLYRATAPFNTPEQATRANSRPITEGRYTDLPTEDGHYYYRLLARNELQTASELSVAVDVPADSGHPQALSIDYTPSGAYDPISGRMASGTVAIALEVNEPLLTTPFLSIAPNGGLPIAIDLTASTRPTTVGASRSAPPPPRVTPMRSSRPVTGSATGVTRSSAALSSPLTPPVPK